MVLNRVEIPPKLLFQCLLNLTLGFWGDVLQFIGKFLHFKGSDDYQNINISEIIFLLKKGGNSFTIPQVCTG